ncbi:hypothetical protein C8J56DRAFT_1110410 [Mycena floridula]|nr:hypothetical protein C8J56DRAFT_1110410 [Mycena floridula]
MHIAILVLGHYRIPNQVYIPLGDKTAFFNTAFSAASQAFAIVYLTILLFITQKLALRRVLSSAKTMTALHDRQSAWVGLGSAVNVLWNQRSVPASVWGVTVVTLYLAFTAGLKITTPNILSLVSVNQTGSRTIQSTLSDPSLLLPIWGEREDTSDPTSPVAQNVDSIRASASYIATLLKDTLTDKPSFGRGLQGNMMYDVVDINIGAGNISVNAHFMNVDCGKDFLGLLKSASLTDTPNSLWRAQPEDPLFPRNFHLIAPNSFILASSDIVDAPVHSHASFVINDSAGNSAPQITLDPPMNPFVAGPFVGTGISSYISQLGLGSASVLSSYNVSSLTTLVDAQTRLPLEHRPRKSSSAWQQLESWDTSTLKTLPFLWSSSLQSFSGSSTNTTVSNRCDVLGPPVPGVNAHWPDCAYMTQAERFVLDKISVSPSTNHSWLDIVPIPTIIPPVPVATVALHDFENAIEDYAAAWFWSMQYLSDISQTSEVPVLTLQVVSELQVVNVPVIAGLILSILLLIIAPAIVGWKYERGYTIPVETLGLLETIWLAGAGDDIAAVVIPSGGNLRQAGMSVSADLSHRQRWVN